MAVKRIKEVGKDKWKKEKGCHIRSKSGVNMFRYKKIFGGLMYAGKRPYKEIQIKCKIWIVDN